ncbi:MAG: VWA domain-containing protein [Candidatus Viridilinea halotolerans]|uniref:VWA domain-containing protein n=1 Tax=Candidatus Viridilinea halotolerans TaxID=2491704 RepID=A0A426TVK4_9CHLR|nr:MAG: VWA domain-containing protein [Candidatus Viridilinea halotolerans]
MRPELMSEAELPGAMLLPRDATLPPVPLEHTEIAVDVVGPLAATMVTQRFCHHHSAALDALYVFPLPVEAAITGFTLQVGTRTIRGELRPREEAKASFDAAAARGADAALLSRQRPNLFSLEVANLQPGEVVEAQIGFFSQVPFDDGWFTLSMPTVVLPRYQPEGAPTGPQEGQVPLLPEGAAGHTLSMRITLDVGRKVELETQGFPCDTSEERGRTVVQLRDAAAVPDRDAVVRYRPAGEGYAAAAFAYRAAGRSGATLLMLTPRALPAASEILPRELLFVFDRSGSMGGDSIVQARNALRACLRALNPHDTFNIFPFDNVVEQLAPAPLPFTQAALDRADQFIAQIGARGGTEIAGAIGAALKQPRDPERLRMIIFLTDGAVGNEDAVLQQLAQQLNEARVFAFGVGSAVNRFLIDGLAKLGRGSAEYILNDEPIEPAVQRFQRRAGLPLLRDLSVDWGGALVTDALPSPLPDLYAGQPLVLLARYAASQDQHTTVTVRGRTAQGSYSEQMQIELPLTTPDLHGAWAALPQLWARARLEVLEDEARHARSARKQTDEAAALALEYGLLSAHTSFVAIEDAPADAQGRRSAQQVVVPVHLPAGTRRAAFEPDAPQMLGGGGPFLGAVRSMALPAPSRTSRGIMGAHFDAMLDSAAFDDEAASCASPEPEPEVAEDYVQAKRSFAAARPTSAPRSEPVVSAKQRREAALRFLGRTQAVSGAWADDERATALAVLAFVHNGHTATKGDFRSQLTRSTAWLKGRPDSPLINLALRALAGHIAADLVTGAAETELQSLGLRLNELTERQHLGGDGDGGVLAANVNPHRPDAMAVGLTACLALLAGDRG